MSGKDVDLPDRNETMAERKALVRLFVFCSALVGVMYLLFRM